MIPHLFFSSCCSFCLFTVYFVEMVKCLLCFSSPLQFASHQLIWFPPSRPSSWFVRFAGRRLLQWRADKDSPSVTSLLAVAVRFYSIICTCSLNKAKRKTSSSICILNATFWPFVCVSLDTFEGLQRRLGVETLHGQCLLLCESPPWWPASFFHIRSTVCSQALI